MKPTEITRHFCLENNDGWQLIDLKKSNENSNFIYAFENAEFSIAWIAKMDKITTESLAKINFHREDPFKKGINLFRPLLLIATNGRNWYISTINEPEFIKKDLNSIKQSFQEGLKNCLAHYREKKFEAKYIENMKRSIIQLNRSIKKKIDPASGSGGFDPFQTEIKWADKEPEKTENYKAMYEVNLMRTNVLEKFLNAKSNEVSDLSILMHNILCNSFNKNQLKTLLEMSTPHIYLNPWYNKNEILVKASHVDLYLSQTNEKKTDNIFYIVDESGGSMIIEIEIQDAMNKLKPGFFKLNKELVKNFLNKN